jgi:glycolate oxidase iron-sulfur subunit
MRRAPGFTIPDPPSAAELGRCVHCGLCLPHCPTFRELRIETESPRGRLHLMRALGEGRVEPTDTFVRHMSLCLDCRACEAACPSGVQFGQLMEATRAEIRRRRPGSRRARALRWLVFRQLLPHPGRLAALGRLLRAYQRLGLQRLVRAVGERLAPPAAAPAGVGARAGQPPPLRRLIEAERLLPPLSARFFEPRGVVPAWGRQRERVAFFAGCVMRLAFAATSRATVRVLARNGCSVALPEEQVCCGALHVHAGDREQAKELARRNVAAFEAGGAEAIVVNAAGCGAALKEYGALLARDPAWAERARAFSARVRDLSELLAELPLDPPCGAINARVAYQDACHLLHAQRVGRQPRDLLRAIPGLELVEMADPDRCCGSAGLYNLTEPELAARFGAQKAANVDATGADLVVSGNLGCLIQLRAALAQRGSRARAVHLADLLDRAYRVATRQETHNRR